VLFAAAGNGGSQTVPVPPEVANSGDNVKIA
jgi:hypothetical protein